MKRYAVVVLALAVAMGLGACTGGGSKAPADSGGSTSGGSGGGTTAKPAEPEKYAEIPASTGPHEKAAYGLVPDVLVKSAEAATAMGQKSIDLSGATPVLFAYQLRGQVGDMVTLFEVRKDGKLCPLYMWPQEPDPAKLVWTPAAYGEAPAAVDPASAPEKAAVAAAKAFLEKAKPGSPVTVKIDAYYFVFVGTDGKPVTKNDGAQDVQMSVLLDGTPGMYPF